MEGGVEGQVGDLPYLLRVGLSVWVRGNFL